MQCRTHAPTAMHSSRARPASASTSASTTTCVQRVTSSSTTPIRCATTSTRVTDRSLRRAVHSCPGHDTVFLFEDVSTNVPEDTFSYESIGVIRTPFDSPDGMPIQPVGADSVTETVEIEEQYADGVADLVGFSHCILLYHFHASGDDVPLEVEPFLDDERRGVFSTRAPQRSNPIGLSVVAIESVTEQELTMSGTDVVDGTPLLDVKPFVPEFDVPSETETGWMDAWESTIRSEQADERFL